MPKENTLLKCALNRKQYFAAFAVYLLITLVLFNQIFFHIFTYAPGSSSQTYLNLWSLWWVNHAVFSMHQNIWHTNLLFFPIGSNLIFQNLSPLGAILVMPFQLINNVLAYNILLLLSFALSGLGMFIFSFYILKNYYAAFVSGLVFSFSSFHIAAAYNNLGLLAIEWVPIALFFFMKMLNNEKHMLKNTIGLSLSFVLASFMGTLKQGFMLILLFIIIFLIYLIKKNKRRIMKRNELKYFIAAMALAFLIGSFGFIPFLSHLSRILNYNNISKAQTEAISSINVLSFFIPGFYSSFYKFFTSFSYMFSGQWQKIGYISYTALILSIYGLYKNKESRMFLTLAIIFGILSLGPFIQIGNIMIHSNIYYFIYNHIPFTSLIAQPSNFVIIFSMMTALLSGFGIKSLSSLEKKKIMNINAFYLAVAVVAVIFLIENNGIPFANALTIINNNSKTGLFFSQMNKIDRNFSILYLPSFPNFSSNSTDPYYYQALATYYTSLSNKSLIGGYVKNENTTQQLSLLDLPLAIQSYSIQKNNQLNYISPINENYSNQTVLLLYNYNTGFIVINRNAYNQSELVNIGGYLTTIFGSPYLITNSSVVFSTKNAFKNIYKTFVGYPQFNTWNLAYQEINGTANKLWVPNQSFAGFKAGLLTEFAPYSNSSSATINTTITFYAVSSNLKSKIILEKLASVNSKSTLQEIAEFNATNRVERFSATAQLNSGADGNLIVFLEAGNAGIENITFSKN